MELLDGRLERIALDEPHGVVRPTARIGAEAINGNDAGVLKAAGDLGFAQKPRAAGLIVGMLLEDLLEGDFAVQLGVDATKTIPSPPRACGRSTRNLCPSLVAFPTA